MAVVACGVAAVTAWSIGTRVQDARIRLRAQSPDARYTLTCYSDFSLDPPNHRLELRDNRAGKVTRRVRLAADSDWCDQIAWSPDRRHAAVLVRGVWVALFDLAAGSHSRLDVVDADGYPGSRKATALRFSDDGRVLLFRVCQRSGGPCEATERRTSIVSD